MVVDDDAMMCALLQRSLQRMGYEAVTQTSPEAALTQLEQHPFDVVLSDLHMDGMDGVDFTHKVMALGRDLPVILITGASTMEVAIDSVLKGAFDFLPKPVEARQLGASLHRALAHRALKQELRALREQVTQS